MLAVIAVALGLISPGAGAAVAISKEALDFGMRAAQRRRDRQLTRLQALVTSLQQRIGNVETKFEEEEVDLFVEVVHTAIKDDESRKQVFYAGILEWIVREKPSGARVRALADAVQRVSFLELAFFRRVLSGQNARALISPDLPADLVIDRLRNVGLSSGPWVMGNPTVLGDVINRYCSLTEVDAALSEKERAR